MYCYHNLLGSWQSLITIVNNGFYQSLFCIPGNYLSTEINKSVKENILITVVVSYWVHTYDRKQELQILIVPVSSPELGTSFVFLYEIFFLLEPGTLQVFYIEQSILSGEQP